MNMVRHRSAADLVLCLLFLVATTAAPVEAQQFKAAITGIITDDQGAVIPGALVVAINIDTDVPTESISDRSGVYALKDLVPGRYRISASVSGFKTFVRDGIVLRTAETATLNIQLTLGALEETITVTAAVSEVETNQSVLSQTMENKRVSELPLNGRQVYMLLQLTSGTLFTQQTFGATGFSGTRAWDVNGSVSIHGSRTGNNEFLIDGASNSGTGGWTYAPPVDAIEEFKVDAASTDAQYGRTSGGVVNLTLKSGTNDLRGSATFLARGTALDANQIQNKRNNISKKGHTYFDVEGMTSGPIRRGRTFFMGGYQGFYEEIPFPSTQTVPTDLQRQGDFSQTFNANGQLIRIFDPLTTTCNAQGVCTREQFPGNRIPQGRMNPVSLALLALMPRPNAPGTITGSQNFVASPNLGHYRYNSYLTRIDHVFTERHRLSFSHSSNWGSERRNENSLPPPALRSDNWPTNRNHYLATADDNLTLGTRTLLNFRVSFDRFNEPHHKEFGPADQDFGFRTPYQLTETPWYPRINITGMPDMFARGFRQTLNNIYGAQATLSRTQGRHLLKTGAEFRLYQLIRKDVGNQNGSYTFGDGFTRFNALQGDGTGNGVATFLLGYPTAGSVDILAESDQRYSYFDVFVQDEWKISGNATLSLGLRWDYQRPVVEAHDFMTVGYDAARANPFQLAPGTVNPATGRPFGTLSGGLLFAGVNGNRRSPYKKDWNNIQPRINFAYRVADWISARLNYGRSYLGITACCGGVQQNGFSRTTNIITAGPQIGVPITTLDSPFPSGQFLQPVGSALGLATTNGQGFSFRNPDFEVPYADQWMAGVNLELPGNMGLNLAYVGNKVSRLSVTRNINVIPIEERQRGIARLGGNPTYLSGQLPNPFAGLLPDTGFNAPTIARRELLRPNPLFGDINQDFNNLGYSTYNALETSLNRRLARGMLATVTYTWSRRRQATALLNPYDERPFEDIDSNDRPHRMTITALYVLPFGPGQRFGGSTSGLVARLIEGWQYNVIGEITSGTPIDMDGNAVPVANRFALPNGQQSLNRWFDTSTPRNPRPDGTYAWDANIGANDFRVSPFRLPDVRQDSKPQWSMSLFKNTRLTGDKILQFRIEVFNVFNTRLYGAPISRDPNNANFGVVSNSQINFPRTGQVGVRLIF
jgi:hypothetical protein